MAMGDGGMLLESAVLGIALAMDAMAVSLSNVLCEPDMPRSKRIAMPVLFALFQMIMPVLGFWSGRSLASFIDAYAGVISLAVLVFVGGKMLIEALRDLTHPHECSPTRLSWFQVVFEAVATSIDAFVVGVSLSATGKNIILYGPMIGLTTFTCCALAMAAGSRLGSHFGARAQLAGGVILILIGVRAFFN